MEKRSVVTWNTIILVYAQAGKADLALELYSRMQSEHFQPDKVTFLAALKACASGRPKYLETGREIHSQVVKAGLDSDNFVANTLLAMYTRCGSLPEAREVLEKIKARDVVSWNAMISGYAENGDGRRALELFSQMELQSRSSPDAVTYLAALKACYSGENHSSKQESLENGRRIHRKALEAGYDGDLMLSNTLVIMYARCGSPDEARRVFERIKTPSVVSWNAIIQGFADSGDGEAALEIFRRMGGKPDLITYLAALKACSIEAGKLNLKHPDGEGKRQLLSLGRFIHEQVKVRGFDREEFLVNGLLTMYSRCGSMSDAQRVFDGMEPSLVSWNALILGFAKSDEFEPALKLLDRMQESGCFQPDKVTILAALKACTRLANHEQGREIEGKVVKFSSLGRTRKIHALASGLELVSSDRRVMNSLISVYSKCGCMLEARRLFNSVESPDVVSWTGLITGWKLVNPGTPWTSSSECEGTPD